MQGKVKLNTEGQVSIRLLYNSNCFIVYMDQNHHFHDSIFWNCATDRLVWFWKLQVIMNKEKTHFVFLNSWQMRNIYYIACKYQVFSVTKLISGGVYWVELTWIEVYEAWEAWNWKLTHKEEAFKSSYIGNYQKSCSLIFISAAKLLPSLAMPFNSSPVGGGEKGEVQKSRKN